MPRKSVDEALGTDRNGESGGALSKKFLSGRQRVALEERKKLLKHLVGKGKGSTFAIPNDEGAKRRGRGMKREKKGRSRGEENRSLRIMEPR